MSASTEQKKELIQNWQKKHHIADDDPLFAAVELFEIYANSLPKTKTKTTPEPPSFSEFRETLEKLDKISKRFTNVAQDLTNQMRKERPQKDTSSGGFFYIAIALIILGSFAGFFIWQYL